MKEGLLSGDKVYCAFRGQNENTIIFALSNMCKEQRCFLTKETVIIIITIIIIDLSIFKFPQFLCHYFVYIKIFLFLPIFLLFCLFSFSFLYILLFLFCLFSILILYCFCFSCLLLRVFLQFLCCVCVLCLLCNWHCCCQSLHVNK